MEKVSEAIIIFLLTQKYIGARHFSEKKLIISRTKWLNKQEKKGFEREYKTLFNTDYIIRLKKRTGKGSDWHISINPKKIKEIYELIDE